MLPHMKHRNLPIAGLLILLLSAVSGTAAQSGEDIDTLESSVEALSSKDGPFSASLFEPLMALARAQLDAGLYADARESLHRNDGVYSLRQQEAVKLLTGILLSEAEFVKANRQQKFLHFVRTHALDPDDPDYLSAYRELADWFLQSGQPRRARRLLEEGAEIADSQGDSLLPWAVLINRARRMEGLCCRPNRLQAALEEDPGAGSDSLVAAYLAIADTLTLGGREEEAAAFYTKAGELSPASVTTPPRLITVRRNLRSSRRDHVETYKIREDPRLHYDRLRRLDPLEQLEDSAEPPGWFLVDADGSNLGFAITEDNKTSSPGKRTQTLIGSPLVFSEDQLDNLLPLKWQKRKEELKIEVSFNVTETGDLEEITVIESNAPSKLRRLITDALRRIYYRPALINGQPTLTRNVHLTQTFHRVETNF
jgi:tetratricopeptide (TPR) repeat protein